METIEVIKDTDFSEEFPIGISILDKNSIHYISEEHAKELYKKLGEVLGMNKVDEEKLESFVQKVYPFEDGAHWNRYQRERQEAYKEGYRKAKEE